MIMNITDQQAWQALAQHQKKIASHHMRDWFSQNENRLSQFSLQVHDLFFDYSRNRITTETLSLLMALAESVDIPNKIEHLMNGMNVNVSENRPALHTALRDKQHTAIYVQDKNIALDIARERERLCDVVHQIHTGTWKGATGKPIKSIINIGIGGSHTGAMMTIHALREYAITDLKFYFLSRIDESHVNEILNAIDAETSLFIISSKSFTTLETRTNTETVLSWMKSKLPSDFLSHHMIAVTAAVDKALTMGIPQQHIFPIWDWVGGRYSIWSAVGLPLMLMMGNDHFNDFLQGAYEIDQHAKTADMTQNMPVLMALLSIWYRNFFHTQSQAIIPYSYRLRYLVPYLQQAEMESNGKQIHVTGETLSYATSPVIFGEEGCLGQHTYHQLLHQGQALIPVDFILVGDTNNTLLLASGLSQAEALMRGKTIEEAFETLLSQGVDQHQAKALALHQMVPGNKPSNIIYLKQITPKNLGALIALYEHKIFVESVIWGINPFDQWGVELGKQLLPDILSRAKKYPKEI